MDRDGLDQRRSNAVRNRHRDEIGLENAEERDDPVRGGWRREQDAISRLEAPRPKRTRSPANATPQFPVRKRPRFRVRVDVLRALTGRLHRDAIRKSPGAGAKDVGKRRQGRCHRRTSEG
jgi:hypothetical protein